ncbi:MAG: RIP metalloprotease RseP [Bacteroidota bacterium]
MEGLIMTAQILLSLSILVGLHEAGHLLAAKWFGMRVEQFSIGFPPKIFAFKYGETEYALSSIPLGGYVKISGMIDESLDTEKMKEPPQPWEFRSKPAWQRLIVMLGGIVVNVITGIFIFVFITYIYGDKFTPKEEINDKGGIMALDLADELGLETGDKIVKINGNDFKYFEDIVNPNVLLSDDPYYTVDRAGTMVDIKIPGNFIERFNDKEAASNFVIRRLPSTIGAVSDTSIAKKIGLKPGDKFVEVDGIPVGYFDEIQVILDDYEKDSLSFKVDREGKILAYNEYFANDSLIGFSPQYTPPNYEVIKYSFGQSIPLGTDRAFGIVFLQLKAFGKMFSGELNPAKSIAGPIKIAGAFGGNWEWQRFWRLTGFLSMVLAFMNLLPIPALDGGHVMFLTYEMISGRKPSDGFLTGAQKVGMLLLLSLMVFVIFKEIYEVSNLGQYF